jgi:hypothetical protein
VDYNAKEPSSSKECACEAERLLNQAGNTRDPGTRAEYIAQAEVWARLAQAGAVRETADPATAK